MITATLVNDLRKKTNAGMMDCKKALTETNGDIEAAVKLLREKGIAKSASKSDREATEGIITARVAADAKSGVLLEVNCETDFVARGEAFQAFCREVCLQIASMGAQYATPDQVPAELIEKERAIFAAQAADSGKPADIVAKMVEGRVNKYLSEVTLLGQPFVKNPDETVEKYLKGKGATVNSFTLFVVGEGIEKKKDDFAAEVAAMAKA